MTERVAQLREEFVATLRRSGALGDDTALERAFLRVPREAFLPGVALDAVYRDDAVVTKVVDGVAISSSSQPTIMALMLRQLDLRPSERVLEIGAGTGYNAALLRELTGPEGVVTTVDIDAEVAGWARQRLDAAGYPDVAVHCADGADGWPDGAPYDRIELTVGATDIAPAWVEQLREGGLLVLPLGLNAGQISLALEKRDGRLVSCSAQPCGFIRLRGRLAGARRQVALTPGIEITTAADDATLARLAEAMSIAPGRETWLGDPWDGYLIGRALRDPAMTLVNVNITRGGDSWAPDGFRGAGVGLYDVVSGSLSAVICRRGAGEAPEQWTWGAAGDAVRDDLRQGFDAWRAMGAPSVTTLRVTIRPLAEAPEPATGETAVDTRWWRITIG